MNALALNLFDAAPFETHQPAPQVAERASPPLSVAGALGHFLSALRRSLRRPSEDQIGEHRRQRVLDLLQESAARSDLDTVASFEAVINGSLSLAYREPPLMRFIFEVLHQRLTRRVQRRLFKAGYSTQSAEVADLVSTAVLAIQNLILNCRRERYTVRYALLLSIADHRAVDYLRRRRPEYCEDLTQLEPQWGVQWEGYSARDPERELLWQERQRLAQRVRDCVLSAVHQLPEVERAALVLVEVEGHSYEQVSAQLNLRTTDVGNVVRRARLRRDRLFVAALRGLEGEAPLLGFDALQADRSLRLNMLGWAAQIGEALCPQCTAHGHLHAPQGDCGPRVLAAVEA